MPKFMYKVKIIAGDYYYEKMSEVETKGKAFLEPKSSLKVLKCQKDIDNYIRDNMNERMPLDGPLWRLYVQDYQPTDQEDVPENERSKGMIILKAHHSFCDGVSIMCMCLALSEEYSRDYFVKSNDAKWYETLFIKVFSVF